MADAQAPHRSEARCLRLASAQGGATPLHRPHRTEEQETDAGPADYALWLDNHIVGLVEAKMLTVVPQNSLNRSGASFDRTKVENHSRSV
jgi:hypothetical protein